MTQGVRLRRGTAGRAALPLVALLAGAALAASESRAVTPLAVPAAYTTLGQTVEADWAKGVVVATGRARAGAGLSDAQAEGRGVGAARTDAMRLLAAAVGGVRVSSSATLEECASASPEVTLRVRAVLRGALPVRGSERLTRLPDGSRLASATVALPLRGEGGLAGALAGEPEGCKAAGAGIPAAGALIVDARGLGLTPCLAPRLLGPDGTVVWSGSGGVAYAASLEEAARLAGRGAWGPVAAEAAKGGGRCDAALPDAALALLGSALTKARLVIAL